MERERERIERGEKKVQLEVRWMKKEVGERERESFYSPYVGPLLGANGEVERSSWH